VLEYLDELPLTVAGLLIVAPLLLYAVGGLLLVRRFVLPRLRISVEDSEFCGSIVQCTLAFYGLATALIAVNVFQTYSDTSKIVSSEATNIAALYRDVTGYPEPIRPRLQGELRDYVRQIIDDAWPLQQRGQVPTAGVQHMNRFQAVLIAFEPATDGQRILHAETLRAYNQMIQARRLRVDAVDTGLPTVMWVVIVLGAFIGLSATFWFKVEDVRLHAIQVALMATFIGLVAFMMFALDHPFRGKLALGPDPYVLIYDQLMKGSP
jgi:hypothetical protein